MTKIEEVDLNLLQVFRLSEENDEEKHDSKGKESKDINLLGDLRISEEEKDNNEGREIRVPDSFPSLEEVEEIIGYRFRNRELLREAYTHQSCKLAYSYQRLEYVGDAVLNLLIAKDDYFGYPDLSPGMLTKLRAANVDTEKLARVALQNNLHKYLRHRKPLLGAQIQKFQDGIADYPLHSNGMVLPPKILADIVESTFGAIFIDSDSSLDITWKVAERLLKPRINPETLGAHPATKLYEICQKHGLGVKIVDDSWKETGEIEVYIDNEMIERVVYKQKRTIALTRAENNAYHKIQSILDSQDQNNNNNNNNSHESY